MATAAKGVLVASKNGDVYNARLISETHLPECVIAFDFPVICIPLLTGQTSPGASG